MRISSTKIVGIASGVVVLTISVIAQVNGQPQKPPGQGEVKAVSQTQNVPPCNATSMGSSAGGSATKANENPHSVTLSWNASVAKSASKLDAVEGYYVYRSLASQTYTENNRINSSPLPGTTCVDTDVQPGEIYYYAVKAVAVGGAKSDFSKEAKAKIPLP